MRHQFWFVRQDPHNHKLVGHHRDLLQPVLSIPDSLVSCVGGWRGHRPRRKLTLFACEVLAGRSEVQYVTTTAVPYYADGLISQPTFLTPRNSMAAST